MSQDAFTKFQRRHKKFTEFVRGIFTNHVTLFILINIVILSGIGVYYLTNRPGTNPATFFNAHAGNAKYYVSTSGNDSNPGSIDSPFKTFAKAMSTVTPGDTVFIAGGTYNESLKLSANGTADAVITVQPLDSTPVIVDMQGSSAAPINITGSYISVSGIEARNTAGSCMAIPGQHVTADKIVGHDCVSHGFFLTGQYISLTNSTLYRSVTENSCLGTCGGWGSGIKVAVGGQHITIANNTVYHNYGEGIAITRGIDATVRGNTVYDNWGVNIYVDNSHEVLVDKNFVYCTGNSGFENSSGGRPAGIAIGEESYSGWGAQLANVSVQNNISAYCSSGIVKWQSSVNGGLKTGLIAHNTLWGSIGTALSIAADPNNQNIQMSNNLVSQTTGKEDWIQSMTGITMSNNFWVNGKPGYGYNSASDKTGDVKLLTTPAFTPDTFRLSSTSPAINAGLLITSVPDDFENKARFSADDSLVDIGAIEFADANGGVSGQGVPPTPVASPVPTPVATPVPTPVATPIPTPIATPIPTPVPTPVATPIASPVPSSSAAAANFFTGQYYDNKDFTNLKLTRVDNAINFNWGNGSPSSLIYKDQFSVRWIGNWDFATSGVYKFTATTDDGMRIWVDGQLILNKWFDQAAHTYTPTVSLLAGRHSIQVDFYENAGQAVAQVSWAKQ